MSETDFMHQNGDNVNPLGGSFGYGSRGPPTEESSRQEE